MTVIGIPTIRVSDLFVSQQLIQRVQADHLALFRLQQALSTGRRVNVPSDDAPAALRGVTLQILLERKSQYLTNLHTTNSFLAATDTALADVTGLLADVRSGVLSVSDTVSSDVQRRAVAQQVQHALEQLQAIANRRFRGRYLFGGSLTQQAPFARRADGRIVYGGDRERLQTFADFDLLFDTNVSGDEVFGAISSAVQGSLDLDPALTPDTPLAALNLGKGVRLGSVRVSVGTSERIVDLSGAATIGDVARLLTANPPPGRTIAARVTQTGLTIEADAAGGGSLTITEVGNGATARDLGIFHNQPTGTGPIVGTDLNPRLMRTTPLSNLLGRKATALLAASGPANDLLIEARRNGSEFNGVTIQLVDDGRLQAAEGLTAGNERAVYREGPTAAQASLKFPGGNNDLLLSATTPGTAFNGVNVSVTSTLASGSATAVYNPATKTLAIDLRSDGTTTANDVIAAINATGSFTAALDNSLEVGNDGSGTIAAFTHASFANTANTGGDAKTLFVYIQPGATTAAQAMAAINATAEFSARLDGGENGNDGSGLLLDGFTEPSATAVTGGGSGRNLDLESGLEIRVGQRIYHIDFRGAQNLDDLLNQLNHSDAGLLAEINPQGTGIDVRSRVSGVDFAIGEHGGTTASDLGIRSCTADTLLADLNHGLGVHTSGGTDFVIRRNDGVELAISVAGARTIGDVLERINQHPANTGNARVVARLSRYGNGIELANEGPPAGTETLSLRVASHSQAAADLGLLPRGASSSGPVTPGTRAQARFDPPGTNNAFFVRAASNGGILNNVTVSFVDTGLGAGNSTASYNAATGTLVFDIDQPTVTAADLPAILAASSTAAGLFEVVLDPLDGSPNDGSGLVGLPGALALQGGTADALVGSDPNPRETEGLFTALARLHDALHAGDLLEIQRAIQLLDDGYTRLTFVRARIGAQQQALDALQQRLEQEQIELRASLSVEIDVDLVTAISDLTARQAVFEASLRTAAQVFRLSLLDFL